MRTLNKRVDRLEQARKPLNGKPLFDTVDDDTTDAEMERLRASGRDPIRWTDAVELCI